jgi:hypothetical protein
MKFKNGDAKHVALASALKHEFLRCADAFDDFAAAAKLSLVKTDDIRLVYRTYNANGRFIHQSAVGGRSGRLHGALFGGRGVLSTRLDYFTC